MITEDLIVYIQAQLRKNISKDIIISRLVGAGWHGDDVSEAFRKITPPIVAPVVKPQSQNIPVSSTPIFNNSSPQKKEGPDLYREPVGQGELEATLSEKPWTPAKTVEPEVKTVEVKPVFSQSFSEANPKTSFTTPVNIAKQSAPQVQNETKLEIRNEELMPSLIPKTAQVIEQAPRIVPKPKPLSDFKMTSMSSISDTTVASDMPNNAILHSYQRALLTASKQNQAPVQIKKRTLIKGLIVILIISAVCGSVFAVAGNHVKLPSFNFSFVKKDPKIILASAPLMLEELKSYKIETKADINFPAFADITSGLLTGEAVQARDTDSFSLTGLGLVNHSSGTTPVFDYKATLHSSLFKNDIVTDLKYNNLITLATTPDFSELLGVNAPKVSNVIVPKGQFSSFLALLPESIANKAKKVDIDKLISIGIPSYVDKDTSLIFKEFVINATLVEKEQEDIRGTLSYHYEINADRATTKKFINRFINVFLKDLSSEEKDLINERLGAITLDSFQVWIGKDDSKIRQYSFALSTPLSRLIGLEDKGIAGNVVSLNWKTTYYDFDVHNDISTPTEVISSADFIKYINDMKIKDKISSFKTLASNLHNSIGKYGKNANPTGSCTSPSPGSLFSPIGHAKGASNAVGNIASLMNDILNTTGGALSCYSTPQAWAISAPLASNGATSFCTDSTGTSTILTTAIKGTICQ